MIFLFSVWEAFCKKISEQGIKSVTAKAVLQGTVEKPYLVLKHDVETDVSSAFKMAEIEHKHGHCGSYYVQGYLLSDEKNISLLKKMQAMGHEVSYHHDVMDSTKGDMEEAIAEFAKNKNRFEEVGLSVMTVCQHGNPIVERVGYTSNRDFFRSEKVQSLYPDVSDIMVNFKEKAATDFLYFSDAGRCFKFIYDPINNDICPSDDKNISFENLDSLFAFLSESGESGIISTHPHRWVKSKAKYLIKTGIFKAVRTVASLLSKIPIFKRIMSKYYYLAKKI